MRTVLAIAALFVTAGCLGVPGLDSPEQTPADGFPPGVTDDGLQNATELLDAHRNALVEFGYAFNVAMTSSRPANISYSGRVRGTAFRLEMERIRDGETLSYSTWANESVVLARVVLGNETGYDQRQRQDSTAKPWRDQLGRILRDGDFTVTDRYIANGRTFVVLEADGTRAERSGTYTQFDARAVVDLDGRVHELNATTAFEARSGVRTHTLDFELTDIGIEKIVRPEWSERALATVSASVDLDSERDYIELEHQGGDPLPEGTTVELTHDNETHTFTFDQTLDVGERAHITYPADGGAPVLSFEEPTGEFERIQGEYEVHVTGPDGASILNAGFAVESGSAEAPDG